MTQDQNRYKYLFGPVVSRRYGRSLGIDLALPKTCSFNCIFCQIGETPATSVTQHSRPPIEDVLKELKVWCNSGNDADVITLAGSGEPTLHRHFGELLSYVKDHTSYPSLLLSNGSLFFLEDVRCQASRADIVKLSLHAWDQTSFQKITRADSTLDFEQIVDGYRRFRDIFEGRIDLEVFVVPGINDAPQQMERIADIAKSFAPDSIFLNRAVRPPADSSVREAPEDLIEKLIPLFGSAAAAAHTPNSHKPCEYSDEALINLVSRHPASISQLAKQFDIGQDVLKHSLEKLQLQKKIELVNRNDAVFILPKPAEPEPK